MPPFRIGINALYLIPGQVGGSEIYLRCLLRALARIDQENSYFIFTNRETQPDIAPAADHFQVVPQPVRATFRPMRLLWEQTILPREAARLRLDVLFNPGFTAPVWCPCPTATLFFDLQYKRHPQYFRWFDLPFWKLFLWASVRRSTTLAAASFETHRDMVRFYSLRPDSVRTIELGVDEHFFHLAERRRTESQQRFLLCVSTLHPHKNLDRLVRAFARFRDLRPEYRLVIAGMRGFYADQLERTIHALKLDDHVTLTGWIPREDLYDLYVRADAFLYPSTFEGFGLPVLEALAAGVPTACSNIEPLRSLAGEAALQFHPEEEDQIRDAMLRLVGDEDLRRRLVAAGPETAKKFSWERTASLTRSFLIETALYRSRSSS